MTEKTSKAEKGPLCSLSSQEPLTVMVREHQRMPTGMAIASKAQPYTVSFTYPLLSAMTSICVRG